MMVARLARPLLLVASVGVSGCAELPYESSPVYSGIRPDLIWDATLEVVQRDYPIASTDRAKRTFGSRWNESLQPMRFQGTRDRVEGRIVPEGDEGFRVEVRVLKQRNEAMEHPLESGSAEWGHEEMDAMESRILLQKIEAILRPYARERRGS